MENSVTPSTMANIEAIAKLEQDFLEQRSAWERIADSIANFTGSIAFVLTHMAIFVFWFLLNSIPLGIPAFDPFPFTLLTMIVSAEGVLLATFVLMKQNRMSRRAEQRDHIHLQIALLAEKEVTKMLQMQQQLLRHHGLEEAAADREVDELSQHTAVDSLARELKNKLPEEAL